MVLCLLALVVAACVRPDGRNVEAPPHYCVGRAEPRAAYFAANYERLAREVVDGQTVVLNQRDPETIRVARLAGTCAPADDAMTLAELQGNLEEAPAAWPRDAERCSITVHLKDEVEAYVGDRNLYRSLGLVGVRVESVLMRGDQESEAEVTVRDDCTLAEPVIHAVVAQVDRPAR